MEDISATPEELNFSLVKSGFAARCSLRARSEDILLNPAPNRVHGAHFVLHYDLAGPALLRDPALAGLAARTGTSFSLDQPAACAPGRTGLTVRAGELSAGFAVDLNAAPPLVTPRQPGSRQLSPAALAGFARLITAAAARAKAQRAAGSKKTSALAALLPKVLTLVEDWR